jgi:hypothetical protein
MKPTNRWTPTYRADFAEKEYVRCDGLRVTLTANSPTYRSEVELSGYTWTEGVFHTILTEHSRRRVDGGGFAPLLLPRFSTTAPDADLVHIDGTPQTWLAFLDASVPLQKISAIVVREFFRQTAEQIQSLRRDGWTILQIGEVRLTRCELMGEDMSVGAGVMLDSFGRMAGQVWARDILAERVEQVVPT